MPGNSLIDALLDRQLMIWSDRGGASHHIGERWADHCTTALAAATGTEWPVPYGEPFQLVQILRLDENPDISKEANRHHLENPDFLLIGVRGRNGTRETETVIQAADAKFAADRIKASQVSTEVTDNLLSVPAKGVTRSIVDAAMRELGLQSPTIVRGVFICPDSFLTDFLMQRRNRNGSVSIDPTDIMTIQPDPGNMFQGLRAAQLIGTLARIDALPVTPRTNLLSAIYYFRLASACLYLWNEANQPLLTNERDSAEPETGLIAAELSNRAVYSLEAYELVASWAKEASKITHARKSIAETANLPVSMREIRDMVARADPANERVLARAVRRELELAFRGRLVDTTGIIYPDDSRSLNRILKDVTKASRNLRSEMYSLASELVADRATLVGAARSE